MSGFYEGWWCMDHWRLVDIVDILSAAGALSEGHGDPETYCLSYKSHRDRILSLIDYHFGKGNIQGSLVMEPATPENIDSWPVDRNNIPIPQIDYFASTVEKKEFLAWALETAIFVPEEFKKLMGLQEEEPQKGDQLVGPAVRAGIFCATQGVEVKKDELQDELGMYGPNFEKIWREVPQRFKLPGGKPKKVIERIIDAAVVAAGCVTEERRRLPLEELRKKVDSQKGLEKVATKHLEMIKTAIESYLLED